MDFQYTGFNVNAQTVLSCFQMNTSLGIALGWGLCLTFAVQMGYRITGLYFMLIYCCWTCVENNFFDFAYFTVACGGVHGKNIMRGWQISHGGGKIPKILKIFFIGLSCVLCPSVCCVHISVQSNDFVFMLSFYDLIKD